MENSFLIHGASPLVSQRGMEAKKPRSGWNFDSVDTAQGMTPLSELGAEKVPVEIIFNFVL